MNKTNQPIPIVMPIRKVTQVVSNIDSVGKYFILAVCNDGTLWKLDGLYEGNVKWEPFPTPPGRDE